MACLSATSAANVQTDRLLHLKAIFPVGTRCSVNDHPATVVYIGAIHFKKGNWIGVEYDKPVGKHNGIIGGQRYFVCRKNCGALVRPSSIILHDGNMKGPAYSHENFLHAQDLSNRPVSRWKGNSLASRGTRGPRQALPPSRAGQLTCASCAGDPGSFHIVLDGLVYCATHFDHACGGCSSIVRANTSHVAAEGKVYHNTCFLCRQCGASLQHYFVDVSTGNIVCNDCFDILQSQPMVASGESLRIRNASPPTGPSSPEMIKRPSPVESEKDAPPPSKLVEEEKEAPPSKERAEKPSTPGKVEGEKETPSQNKSVGVRGAATGRDRDVAVEDDNEAEVRDDAVEEAWHHGAHVHDEVAEVSEDAAEGVACDDAAGGDTASKTHGAEDNLNEVEEDSAVDEEVAMSEPVVKDDEEPLAEIEEDDAIVAGEAIVAEEATANDDVTPKSGEAQSAQAGLTEATEVEEDDSAASDAPASTVEEVCSDSVLSLQ